MADKVRHAILKVKEMVQDNRELRPYSRDLWKAFDFAPQQVQRLSSRSQDVEDDGQATVYVRRRPASKG